jgi:hypothetical protein
MPTHRLVRPALAAVCFAPVLLLLASCEQKSAALRQYISNQITTLKDADPKADLDAALAKGDFRFLALRGIGPMVPAVGDKEIPAVESRYGLRYIDNTSDKPQDDQEKELEVVAWGYAEKYNTLLRKKLKLQDQENGG